MIIQYFIGGTFGIVGLGYDPEVSFPKGLRVEKSLGHVDSFLRNRPTDRSSVAISSLRCAACSNKAATISSLSDGWRPAMQWMAQTTICFLVR